LSRNDERITDTLLGAINPIKKSYKHFIQEIEDKSDSYFFQEESIEKLDVENRILRQRLLEQMHYLEEIKNIYNVLPDLSHTPFHSTSIVETISYIKLNTYSQIILTQPKNLKVDTLYGMVQGDVVAGVASLQQQQLYGYLTSDKRCRFSVFIGESNAPGIAEGIEDKKMVIKFIPKWHHINIGDKVYTSGLDNIFFSNIPVGIVTKVEVQSAYTVAHIETYSNIYQPKTFLLIHNDKKYLTENFDAKHTKLKTKKSLPSIDTDTNTTSDAYTYEQNVTIEQIHSVSSIPNTDIMDVQPKTPSVSSIPNITMEAVNPHILNQIDQTQENTILPEAIEEVAVVKKHKIKRKRKVKRKKRKPRNTSKTLDLF
jgi:rod shape-determining protein MreC